MFFFFFISVNQSVFHFHREISDLIICFPESGVHAGSDASILSGVWSYSVVLDTASEHFEMVRMKLFAIPHFPRNKSIKSSFCAVV